MKRILMVLAVLCVSVTVARAGDDMATRRALAEQLMVLMNVPQNIEKSFAVIKKMLPAQMEQMSRMAGQTNVPPEAVGQTEKVLDMVAAELQWEKVKDDYVALYAGILNEGELKAAIEYYKTAEGQSFVNKQAELMKGAMELNQKLMMKLMPRIQEMSRQMKQESGAAKE